MHQLEPQGRARACWDDVIWPRTKPPCLLIYLETDLRNLHFAQKHLKRLINEEIDRANYYSHECSPPASAKSHKSIGRLWVFNFPKRPSSWRPAKPSGPALVKRKIHDAGTSVGHSSPTESSRSQWQIPPLMMSGVANVFFVIQMYFYKSGRF